MLSDGVGSDLAEQHREQQLSRVCLATTRMDRMVDALLEISRVGGKPVERGPIDLSGLAAYLAAEMAREEPGRQVQFEVEDGLRAEGDRGLVRSLLRELLSNAWKFTRNIERARVEVGRIGSAFYVRDDGPGFDMQHASRMFDTFERLHHSDEFEGEGVGLAIAARVARRHGGRIWAESRPGAGATLFFTLSDEDSGAVG
ncbi:MAG TPA: ATP-binding protein [Candidatus Binatia bacterium]|nr:ATP-binding protein [Candidatus Binatia bacterium]